MGNKAGHEIVRLAPLPSRLATPVARLQFDKVVLRLMSELRTALQNAVPDNTTALFTLTAPIRLPGKTAAAIEETIRARIGRASPRDIATTLHGNEVRVRIVRHALVHAPSLLGFVHNPEPNPHRLMDCAAEWLGVLGSAGACGERSAGPHVLQVHGPGRRALMAVDRYVCSQFLRATPFSAIVLIDDRGHDSLLAD